MPGRSTPRNTLILLVTTCIVVFTVGLVLLVVGFMKYTKPNPSVPYMWGITLCRVNGTEKWVGMELGHQQACPLSDPVAQPQAIMVPPGVLVADVPYNPVIYVTNKGVSLFKDRELLSQSSYSSSHWYNFFLTQSKWRNNIFY